MQRSTLHKITSPLSPIRTINEDSRNRCTDLCCIRGYHLLCTGYNKELSYNYSVVDSFSYHYWLPYVFIDSTCVLFNHALTYSTAGLAIATTIVSPDSTIPITNVGPCGVERGLGLSALACLTTIPETTVWLFPNGTIVPLRTQEGITAPSNTIQRLRQGFIITLHRGDGSITPAGQYCCGSATNMNERLCVTLGK